MHRGSNASGEGWLLRYRWSPEGYEEPLPPEIAFLAAHGVTIPQLIKAKRYALLWGVTPSEALLALGFMDEEAFYRALAAETGIPLLPADIAVSPSAPYDLGIRAGIVALQPNRRHLAFAIAPRGSAVQELLLRGPKLARQGVALVSPRRLAERVMAASADRIAQRAANELPDEDPALSARDGATKAQVISLATAVGAASFMATLAPDTMQQVVIGVISLVFLAMITVRLACCLERVPIRQRRKPALAPDDEERGDEHLPVYTIIVPLFRETRVLRQIVGALQALDYPAAKLDIKLVLEEDDAPMRAAVRAMEMPNFIEVLIAPVGQPRTKPRALNVALPLARGEFVVVYDAEDVPDRDQLRLAVATFARMPRSVVCLQARLVIDNLKDGLLATLFAIEYMALFDVINPGLASYGLPLPLGGTSNHFRTQVLRDIKGWDAWNVTEDADLGVRLACRGYDVADLPSATLEEAPMQLGAWMRQRARWMKGWMQVCVTHSRMPLTTARALGGAGSLGVLTMAFGTVATALGYPLFAALAVIAMTRLVLNGGAVPVSSMADAGFAALALVVFAAGFVSMLLPPVIGIARRGPWRLMLYVPLLPFYYVLVSVASWRGLAGLVTSPFTWNKTEHGLSARRRSLQITGSSEDLSPRRPVRV
ncbi:cellulose synthase/poly-beta-1,6-N-acetylglucosamine synthase-like glycosyltransferase [Chelatococcus asaccharovorans]|uniref:Cellulose synthase/poly-beta-1,6-N-acetylglucosamine synthase-like glycosyltransferase n=1 Tax=Chelatococcus asaccharovorans TaxID=28210 RepID=A0A2V3UKK0_9HYPH|nr:cellulose synthase/poly-beta-1,6-N-acetylglucosamine synthase-like glycosyltransferase [Chelatococcus asaccharovorans]